VLAVAVVVVVVVVMMVVMMMIKLSFCRIMSQFCGA